MKEGLVNCSGKKSTECEHFQTSEKWGKSTVKKHTTEINLMEYVRTAEAVASWHIENKYNNIGNILRFIVWHGMAGDTSFITVNSWYTVELSFRALKYPNAIWYDIHCFCLLLKCFFLSFSTTCLCSFLLLPPFVEPSDIFYMTLFTHRSNFSGQSRWIRSKSREIIIKREKNGNGRGMCLI